MFQKELETNIFSKRLVWWHRQHHGLNALNMACPVKTLDARGNGRPGTSRVRSQIVGARHQNHLTAVPHLGSTAKLVKPDRNGQKITKEKLIESVDSFSDKSCDIYHWLSKKFQFESC